ncbi:MAG: small-conductance mechanosensitive ion channel [Actinobacteria bacterium]|nr:small-conductance mechanosensitive ion channel [Actinomycetota bacterium]
MPVTPITDLGVAVTTSIATALALLLGGIPKIIAFAAIVIIGWFIASIIAKLVATVLRKIRFNDIAQRAGLSGFVNKMGVKTDPSGIFADIVKWFIRLIVLVAAFDALGLPAVSDVLKSMLLFLPNLIVALVVLVIAGLAANAIARVVQGAATEAEVGNPELLAKVASYAVWTFGIVVAINQLGIATTLVNTLFMGLVGAFALALGLAFGLGGRETAGRLVASWYASSGVAKEKAQRAVEGARRAEPYDSRTTPREEPTR